ncbi:MAG TPA: hypothetical protein VGM87_16255 [Roseomonas sp.]
MRRPWLSILGGGGVALAVATWGAAILLPAPPFGIAALQPAQRALRAAALASSAEGLAAMPRAGAWLDGKAPR